MTDFLDIDFDNETPGDQSTGLIEESRDEIMAASSDTLGPFEDSYPTLMVPRAKRQDMAAAVWPKQRRTIAQIYSQGRTSACVGFAAAQALEITRHVVMDRPTESPCLACLCIARSAAR